MPEISQITSEALQATLRRLLPSQTGFGTDLEASNVITPIIDLTPTAEGSSVPSFLQTALAFGSQTNIFAQNTTQVVANTGGFYRIIGTATVEGNATTQKKGSFAMSDGLSSTTVWAIEMEQGDPGAFLSESFDFYVFLAAGESISAVSNGLECVMSGSVRAIADLNGNLISPSGFQPQ